MNYKCRRCSETFEGPEARRQWLCKPCHLDMASRSRVTKSPCTCVNIVKCTRCRNREYKYVYDKMNKEKNATYHIDWRWNNMEQFRAKKYKRRIKQRLGIILHDAEYARLVEQYPSQVSEVVLQVRSSRTLHKATPEHQLVWYIQAPVAGTERRIRAGVGKFWRTSNPLPE